MKKMKQIMLGGAILVLFASGITLLLTGCSTIVEREEFEHIAHSTVRDTLGAVYYKGREGGFDYFKAQWNVGSKNLRLKIGQSPITNPFPYTSDEKKWRAGTFMHMTTEELRLALPKSLNTEQNCPAPDGASQ